MEQTDLKSYTIPLGQSITPEQKAYLEAHPELKPLLAGFLSTVLTKQPSDIGKLASEYFTGSQKPTVLYKPLVISGPSGVGKGTLIKMLLDRYPDVFELSISYTTRKPRQGEQHAVQYFFVSPEEFSLEIPKKSYIEYTEVHGNFYGTTRQYVESVIRKKKICLLEIDVVGAQKVSKSGMDCNYVFIEPPSIEELKQRLIGRGTENPDKVQLRMTNAIVELEMAKSFGIYQRSITNDILDQTFKDLVDFINSYYIGLDLHV